MIIFKILIVAGILTAVYFMIRTFIMNCRDIRDIKILRKSDQFSRCSQFHYWLHRCTDGEDRNFYDYEFYIDYDTPDEWYVSGKMRKTQNGWDSEIDYYHQEKKHPEPEIDKLATEFLTNKFEEI